MTPQESAHVDISASELFDLEFLVVDFEAPPLARLCAPFERRDWALFTVASWVAENEGATVDRRTADGWETDVNWRALAH